MLADEANDPAFDYTLNYRFMPTPSYGTVGIKGRQSERTFHNKYKERLTFVLSGLGFEVIKWLGLEDSEVRVQEPVLPGADDETVNTDLKESKLFSKEWWNKELLIEAGEEYWTDKSVKGQQKYIGKHDTTKKVEPVNPSGKEERSIDPFGNPFLDLEDDNSEKERKEIHAKHYVVEDENSLVVGTAHLPGKPNPEDYDDGEKDEDYLADVSARATAKEFIEDPVMKGVEKFIKDNKGEKIIFLSEGGLGVDADGNPHHYWEGSEQEIVANAVSQSGGEVDSWDGKFNNQWDGHETAPIYTALAEKMGTNPKTNEPYTPSQMSGAIYSNLVGQGDDGEEHMDYLTEDGKQFLIDNGYTGEFPPKDKSEIEQLKKLNYPEDFDGSPGDGEVGRAQLEWNQARRDNMAEKMKEYEDAGYKAVSYTHLRAHET